jgi:hypothetical protein
VFLDIIQQPIFYLKNNVWRMDPASILRQEPTQLGPINRASLYLQIWLLIFPILTQKALLKAQFKHSTESDVYSWYLCNILHSTCSEVWQIPGASETKATWPDVRCSALRMMQFCGSELM